MNLNNIEKIQMRIVNWIESQVGSDGLWGLGINPFFDISQTTFAIRVLLWHNSEEVARFNNILIHITKKLLSYDFPKYTRSYSWFLYLFADEIYKENPDDLKRIVEIIISLKNEDNSWGHGKSDLSKLKSGEFHVLPTSLAILALSKSALYLSQNTPIIEIIKQGVKLLIEWLDNNHVSEIALRSIALLAIFESKTHQVNVEYYSRHIEYLKSESLKPYNLKPLAINNAAGNLDIPYYLHTPAWCLLTLSAIGDDISVLESKLFIYQHIVKLITHDGAAKLSNDDKELFIYKSFNVYFAFKQFSESVYKDRLLNSMINDPDAIKKIIFNHKKKKHPQIFIGSSVEGLDVARKIKTEFEYDNFNATVWNQGIFTPSSTTIESLEDVLKNFDFAILVLTPDDTVISKHKTMPAIRDNVVFELGLFIGKLGRKKVFIVHPRNAGIKIPTDLCGINVETYDKYKYQQNPQSAIGAPCDNIRNAIEKISQEI